MATKDYVKRGRSTKSAKKKTPDLKAPTTSGFPVNWAIFAIFLVIALISSLFFLSQTEIPEETPAKADVVEPTKLQPSKAQNQVVENNVLPPKPKEKWSYIEELENKEIIVPQVSPEEKEKIAAAAKSYLLQCGAYRTPAQADERKAIIAFQGLNSQIKITKNDKGTWYRVVLGPYKNKRYAENDKNKLQNNGISPCAIWFWE